MTDTLLLRNVEFWDVRDLEITNLGDRREPWRTGVRVVAEDFGTMRHIQLRNLFVHDVNGDLRKSHEGCGIYFETRGQRTPSRFDDLLVEDCHIQRTDRNGICQRNGSGPHSTRVVIRGNLLEDIGGDGIKPWGCDAPLVEYNTVRGGRMRCEDAAAGIWPFDCNNALIQFNEVSGMKGTVDGQGFDSDFQCRGSVFQYNYSHDNEGGFMLVCSPGKSFNDGTIIRYNISRNDGINSARVFHFGGASTNTLVYNNTIYIGPGRDLPLLLFSEWDGAGADGVKFSQQPLLRGRARDLPNGYRQESGFRQQYLPRQPCRNPPGPLRHHGPPRLAESRIRPRRVRLAGWLSPFQQHGFSPRTDHSRQWRPRFFRQCRPLRSTTLYRSR